MPIKRYEPSPHFIAYFDILGYGSIIHDRPKFLAGVIDRMLSGKFRGIQKLDSSIRPIVFEFSDNFAICYKCQTRMDGIDYSQLGQIIVMVQQLQTQLLIKGVVVRGSIMVGDLYTSKHYVAGRGIADASVMEKNAINPRIVVAKDLLDAAIHQAKSAANVLPDVLAVYGHDVNWITESNVIGLHFLIWAIVDLIEHINLPDAEEKKQIAWGTNAVLGKIFNDCILKDADGQYYINHMQHVKNAATVGIDTFDDADRLDKLMLHMHENIKAEIDKNKNNGKVLSKYIWLLNYLHSWFMSSEINNAAKYAALMENELRELTPLVIAQETRE